jgi:hypothetical protein
MGEATTLLQVAGSEIKMIYTSKQKPSGCFDFPQTTVFFKCPERGGVSDHCKVHVIRI